MQSIGVNGILLLYHHFLVSNAPTIMEHVNAFERHSRFKVWKVNTELGFPPGLNNLDFQVIVLHYSLFGWSPHNLPSRFLTYLRQSHSSFKVAFFQDEHRYWPQRADFINRYQLDCVFTLVEPPYFRDTYLRYTRVPKLVYTLPGYVSDDLVAYASDHAKRDHERRIDVGYRGRLLPHWSGRGAQEKYIIGIRFRRLAEGLGLRTDIECEEHKRLYGKKYYEFLANCRAVLGVEAGVSIFDIDNIVRLEYERLVAINPGLSFEEADRMLLHQYEGNIPYRTISPRHFEAAAFRVCQILFEGRYSGILSPMVHYIPLKKDFSNFGEVIQLFRDESVRGMLVENAYQDLIASGRFSYRRFIEEFDAELLRAGFDSMLDQAEAKRITERLDNGKSLRQIQGAVRSLRYRPFPGREPLRVVLHPVFQKLRELGVEWI
jgi:hypothetical protein